MKLTSKTGAALLTCFINVATVCEAQERKSPAAGNSQNGDAAIGFQCPSGEPNQPRPKLIQRLGNITRKALALPQPKYPQDARVARTTGTVEAEVVIEINTGRIVWARILSGPPMLQEAVRSVVCQARFPHTNDANGRVSGTLTYRFGRRRRAARYEKY